MRLIWLRASKFHFSGRGACWRSLRGTRPAALHPEPGTSAALLFCELSSANGICFFLGHWFLLVFQKVLPFLVFVFCRVPFWELVSLGLSRCGHSRTLCLRVLPCCSISELVSLGLSRSVHLEPFHLDFLLLFVPFRSWCLLAFQEVFFLEMPH